MKTVEKLSEGEIISGKDTNTRTYFDKGDTRIRDTAGDYGDTGRGIFKEEIRLEYFEGGNSLNIIYYYFGRKIEIFEHFATV